MLIIERALPKRKRPNGLRAFTASKDFKDLEIGHMLKEKMEAVRKEKGDPELRFTQQEKFEMMEKLKIEIWSKLDTSLKQKYRNAAAEAYAQGVGIQGDDAE